MVLTQFIHLDDLPNYRLASKLCAEAGRPELFHTITFQRTLASASRLKHFIENEHLSKLVRTVIWDTNLWRVGNDVRDWHEWTRYCDLKAEHNTPFPSALYKELAASRQHWEAYLTRLEKELEIVQQFKSLLMNPSYVGLGLPNLHKIHVIRGAYQLDNRHVRRIVGHPMLPVGIVLKSWKGDRVSSCLDAVSRALIFNGAVVAKEMYLDGLPIQTLNRHSVGSRYSNLTTIKIRRDITKDEVTSDTQRHWLPTFLGRWHNLENLSLDLRDRTIRPNHIPPEVPRSVRTIQDTFEIARKMTGSGLEGPVIWPKLRRLSLRHFDTTSDALLSLVTRHSSTLRDLGLHDIWLCAEGPDLVTQQSWREVFHDISSATNLDNISVSGMFRYNDGTKRTRLNFDEESRANATTSWIIQGRDCPLADEEVKPEAD